MNPEDAREPRAHCTAGDDGGITWLLDLPPASHPQLVLRLRPKKGQEEKVRHVLDLEPAGDGRWRAVQGAEPRLREGRWDTYVVLRPGGERTRLRPGLRDLRHLTDGNDRTWPSPLAVRIPYVTKDGYLALRAWLRTAHSEAYRISLPGGALRVSARMHGTQLGTGAAVVLRGRNGSRLRTLELHQHDARDLVFTVDYGTLADGGGTAGDQVWDVFLRPREGAERIRVGRLLDDVADRKPVCVYPATVVDGARVRPYFTVDNDLAIEVSTG